MEFEENPTKKKLTNMKVVLNEYLAKQKQKLSFSLYSNERMKRIKTKTYYITLQNFKKKKYKKNYDYDSFNAFDDQFI